MDTSLSIFSDYTLHRPELISTDFASTLLLLLTGALPSDSVITNISVIQSWNWFFLLTPFESIFLGFIVAQIAVLNILGVLPININKILTGDPAGRKKRHVGMELEKRRKFAHTMINVLKRMDRDECFVKSLCVVQLREASDKQNKLPKDIRMLLKALHISADRRKTAEPLPDEELSSALVPLEKAVEIGLTACANPYSNSTICDQKYKLCPATAEDIYSYIDQIYTYFF